MKKQIEALAPRLDKDFRYTEADGRPFVGVRVPIKMRHRCGLFVTQTQIIPLFQPTPLNPIHHANANRMTPWEMKTFHRKVKAYRAAQQEREYQEKLEPLHHELAVELNHANNGRDIKVSVPHGFNDAGEC